MKRLLMALLILLPIQSFSGEAMVRPIIPKLLYQQIIKDHYSDNLLRKPAIQDILFREFDINQDRGNEYLIEGGPGYCGSRGCSLWIYRNIGERYKLIYDQSAVANLKTFELSILKTQTKGWPDLIFKNQDANGEIYFIVAFFNGDQYQDYNPCD